MVGDLQVTFGDTKWTIRAARIRSWITFETDAAGATVPVLDESKIPPFLSNIAKTVKRAPVSASFLKTRGGRIVGVVAATNGRKLDTAATASAIAAAIKARGTGAAPVPVEVEVASVAPKFTTAQAVKRGPLMQALGTWKTWFPVGERNYFGANIWRPAEVIDGTVLMPGQRFEWWSALGTVSSATGYGPGGFIAGDHTDPTGALGGGMCSSSTTLFNAALRAGLQMGARANHKYYIDRYPLGLDATVSKTRNGSQTISFTNDTKGPIVIRTFRYRAGGRGWVRYEIWGVPDGRTVSLSRPSVANVRKASTTTRYVSTLPTGVREQIEYPANGMDVAVSRVVHDKRGRVIHSETYRTHYVLWNGIVNVGR
jgi:vancomycin resistance protein YoaR